MPTFSSASERERLLALASYDLLDTAPEPEFDQLTALAAELFHVPIAMVSLVDEGRVWHKSMYGFGLIETPRAGAFCAGTILGDQPLIVPDAAADARFSGSLLVTGASGIRFYAGAPLITRAGLKLGSFCLMDRVPRVFSDTEATSLTRMATIVMAAIEARQSEHRLRGEMAVNALTTQALRLVEARYERIAENTPGMVYQMVRRADGPAEFLFVSAACREIFEQEPTVFLRDASEYFKLVHPEDNADRLRVVAESLATMQPVRWEGRHILPSGQVRWIQISAQPERTVDGDIYWDGVALDITERRTAQQALEEARDQAERANHAKSEFLSRMSHELRTPLNAILGFGQLLEMSGLTPKQQENISHVLRGGRHLLDLINEVLDIARIEAGRLELSFEPVHVASALEEAVALVRPLADKQGISLDISRAERSLDGIAVQADRQRLKQVLLNLLSNAIKYNRPFGRVDLTCERVGTAGRLRLSVRDTGPGIGPEDLDKLFTPFERLDAANGEVEGTGIGLAISKRLLEAMGGVIGVESIDGHGSTFSLELPIAPGTDQDAKEQNLLPTVPAADSVADIAQSHTQTVLYIEDNASNLALVEEVLSRRSGVELLSATRAQAGLQLARQRLPDLILLDLQLPDLAGDALLRLLKEDPLTHGIPVLMVSADATPTQIQRLLDLGATAYLTKPLDLPVFLRAVDGALAVKR